MLEVLSATSAGSVGVPLSYVAYPPSDSDSSDSSSAVPSASSVNKGIASWKTGSVGSAIDVVTESTRPAAPGIAAVAVPTGS